MKNINENARKQLIDGINTVANVVSKTMGPKGRNVVIERTLMGTELPPHVTKDGVTVAKEIHLPDPVENAGAQMIKEAAARTADIAGDGTTTATVIARKIITACNYHISNTDNHVNPIGIKTGIDTAVNDVIVMLDDMAIDIKDDMVKIQNIATISANNDNAIGELIASAYQTVGIDGVITVEEALGTETELKTVEGMEFNRGYISPYFINEPQKMKCEYEAPYILICDKKITDIKQLIKPLEVSMQANRPIVIIAEDFDADVLSTLVINRVRGNLKVVAIKAPGFGESRTEQLIDIATLTNGTVVSETLGMTLENIEQFDGIFGSCEKIIVSRDNTTIINGSGSSELIQQRIEQIKTQIDDSTSDYAREKLQERLGKMAGGVAVIRVGAPTELEMKEKKDRVDDALHATKAAIVEGIVPGAGMALVRIVEILKAKIQTRYPDWEFGSDEYIGYTCLLTACLEPAICIINNAGLEWQTIRNQITVSESWLQSDLDNSTNSMCIGFDVKNNRVTNLIESGIIDPKKVTRVALQHAASVATMVLLTEASITNIPQTHDSGASQNNTGY